MEFSVLAVERRGIGALVLRPILIPLPRPDGSVHVSHFQVVLVYVDQLLQLTDSELLLVDTLLHDMLDSDFVDQLLDDTLLTLSSLLSLSELHDMLDTDERLPVDHELLEQLTLLHDIELLLVDTLELDTLDRLDSDFVDQEEQLTLLRLLSELLLLRSVLHELLDTLVDEHDRLDSLVEQLQEQLQDTELHDRLLRLDQEEELHDWLELEQEQLQLSLDEDDMSSINRICRRLSSSLHGPGFCKVPVWKASRSGRHTSPVASVSMSCAFQITLIGKATATHSTAAPASALWMATGAGAGGPSPASHIRVMERTREASALQWCPSQKVTRIIVSILPNKKGGGGVGIYPYDRILPTPPPPCLRNALW